MYIYKITNIQNNKIYIGQTIRPIIKRFRRHMTDALNKKIDTKFCRAICKYGRDNFQLELIDTANNQNELNDKELYWINYYDSVNKGYNSTDDKNKCGGNTYKYIKDLSITKEKIRKTKIGGKNPNARKIVMINTITNERKIYDSMQECANELQLASHMQISRWCRGKTTTLINKKFKFEYIVE